MVVGHPLASAHCCTRSEAAAFTAPRKTEGSSAWDSRAAAPGPYSRPLPAWRRRLGECSASASRRCSVPISAPVAIALRATAVPGCPPGIARWTTRSARARRMARRVSSRFGQVGVVPDDVTLHVGQPRALARRTDHRVYLGSGGKACAHQMRAKEAVGSRDEPAGTACHDAWDRAAIADPARHSATTRASSTRLASSSVLGRRAMAPHRCKQLGSGSVARHSSEVPMKGSSKEREGTVQTHHLAHQQVNRYRRAVSGSREAGKTKRH